MLGNEVKFFIKTFFQQKNEIQMLMIGFNVNGSLKTIQKLEVNDLNFCDESTMEYTHIKFAKNFKKTCSVNLKRLIATHEEPLLYDLYLNYTENNLHLLKSVPVLIRNAFTHNVVGRVYKCYSIRAVIQTTYPFQEQNRDKWQLVKRFFLLDTITDQNATFRKRIYSDRDELYRFHSLRYVKNVEMIFTINNDHSTHPNRMSVPVLKMTYGEVNITTIHGKSFNVYLDFQIKIKFVKNYEFGSAFDVIF